MKQIYLKLSMLLACMLIGLGSAWGETYTIDFNKGTTNGTSISGTIPKVLTLCTSGADNISTINTSTNCYYNAKGCGVRLGKDGGAGTFKITLSKTIQEATISKVVVYASKVSDNTVSKLTVTPNGTVTSSTLFDNGTLSAYSTSSSESTNYELSEISINGTLNTLQFEAPSKGYVMLHRIDIVTSSSTAPTIALSNESLDFGTVEQNSEVSAKTITATIANVSSATVALSGEGASAFSLDKTSLTESGSITITPNTTAVGTYEATLTLSAEGATSVTKNVKMTVSAPKTYYAVVSKYGDKYYAMGSTVGNKTLNAVEVTVCDGYVINAADEDAISWTLNTDGTVENKAGNLVTYSKADLGLATSSTNTYTKNHDDNGFYWESNSRAFIYVSDGWFKNYAISNVGKTGYGTIGYLMPFKTMPTINLNASGYATYSRAYSAKIEGAQVYTATLSDNTITCRKVDDNIVPAGVGVLLYGDASAKVTIIETSTSKTALENNDLKASTLADGSIAIKPAGGAYTLSGDTFKNYTKGTFVAGKAYFEKPATTDTSKLFSIVFADEETAITTFVTTPIATGTVYNLSGQRVLPTTKGIVIINGKKYFNK